ncbi:hypothetical protein F5884DRAFT_900634 [Xylogone sp. PMI_703]|nr:hypothetical protein F5884DRAFT_900634 [Xylogone sp. PMI_703]
MATTSGGVSRLETSLDKLSIEKPNQKSSKKKQPVADSWEDEDLSSGEETDKAPSPQQTSAFPNAPPPTPISPTISQASPESFTNPYGYDIDGAPGTRQERSDSRPEKTDAVARRLIAGALGVRAPKKTEEQRAYDRAVREKEMKKRNQEKEAAAKAQEEAEKAKAAMWED